MASGTPKRSARRGPAPWSAAERGPAPWSAAERGPAPWSAAERGPAPGSAAERGPAPGSAAERGGGEAYEAATPRVTARKTIPARAHLPTVKVAAAFLAEPTRMEHIPPQ